MADIMTPTLGESVTEATVARWAKKAGEAVKKDEILVELETDKVSLEVASPADGVLASIGAEEGATVVPGTVLGVVTEGGAATAAPAAAAPKAAAPAPASAPTPAPAPAPVAAAAPAPAAAAPVSPAPARVAAENNLDLSKVAGTGKDGRVTKGDALVCRDIRTCTNRD